MAEYTSVERMFDVEPAIKGVSDVTSEHLGVFIQDAEAIINARLARLYTLPMTNVPILIAIATDMAIYRALTRRIFTEAQLKDSTWPDRFKESEEFLKEISEGKMELVNSAGAIVAARTDQTEVWSSTEDYLPTFHEGSIDTHFGDNIQDEDKVDDLLDTRDL